MLARQPLIAAMLVVLAPGCSAKALVERDGCGAPEECATDRRHDAAPGGSDVADDPVDGATTADIEVDTVAPSPADGGAEGHLGARDLALLTTDLGDTFNDAGASSPPAVTTAPCTSAASCRASLSVASGAKLAVYRSYDLERPPAGLTGAVVIVHGTSRDSLGYYNNMMKVVRSLRLERSVLVVAPLFQESPESTDELYWSGGDWREGADGATRSGLKFSAYAALDRLLERLADPARLPFVTRLTIAGHSAGGQVVQRYAAGGRPELTRVVPIRYVVANPSSYLYLNAFRFVEGAGFVESGQAFSRCTSYDHYKYGLKDRRSTPYMAAKSDAELIQDYLARDVRYLLGLEDTCNSDLDSCNDSTLDKSCEAMLQGTFRLERGRRFFSHLERYYPTHQHTKIEVPDVGHSNGAMWDSPLGRTVLFK